MAVADLSDWITENTGPNIVWYVKRLSSNDTLASNAHQAGPYIPKPVLFDLFPSLNRPQDSNPDLTFELRIDSHGDVRNVRAVWYNNKFRGGTRDEARLTNFGGASSPLLDPENTGSLVVFAFHRINGQDASICNVWVCDDATGIQADLVEERIGPVEPGKGRLWTIDEEAILSLARPQVVMTPCWLRTDEIPPEWLLKFPTGEAIIRLALARSPLLGSSVDDRLIKRRKCEFEMFQSLEHAIESRAIRAGFDSLDAFLAHAQSILQRRKARSGRSLELHAKAIFEEENLRPGKEFDHQPETESGKKPDFLFPSREAYRDPSFPSNRLRMLAVKTTCKDRWRQVMDEANRIERKHLLTLQEGVSETQFLQMREAKIQLVVPAALISSYPESVRPHLQTFENFIGDLRHLSKD